MRIDPSNPGKLGEIVRYHRDQAGLTQIELAELADLGKTSVFDVEKGKSTVRLDTLLKILTVLNVNIHLEGPLVEAFEAMEQSQRPD